MGIEECYFESWPPAEGLHECRVERAEVDQRVRSQVKVGNQRSDEIQIGCKTENVSEMDIGGVFACKLPISKKASDRKKVST